VGEKHKDAPKGSTHWKNSEIAVANNKYKEGEKICHKERVKTRKK